MQFLTYAFSLKSYFITTAGDSFVIKSFRRLEETAHKPHGQGSAKHHSVLTELDTAGLDSSFANWFLGAICKGRLRAIAGIAELLCFGPISRTTVEHDYTQEDRTDGQTSLTSAEQHADSDLNRPQAEKKHETSQVP